MALSRTLHTGFLSTTSATSATSGSYTFGSGSVVLVCVSMNNDAGAENPSSLLALSDTGAGITWTKVAFKDSGNAQDYEPGVAAFVGIGNGSSCTLTASKTGNAAGRWYIQPISWTGGNTSTPTGATMAYFPNVADGTVTGTLSGTPASTSEVVGFMAGSINDTSALAVDNGSGYTELWDVQSDDFAIYEGEVRGGSTSTTVDWADIVSGASTNGYYRRPSFVAVEIVAGAGGGGAVKRNNLMLFGVGR